MRLGLMLGTTLLLAGCAAIPPAVSIATWAIDGATLAISGKSVSDHALSAATQRDCAIWRLLKGEPVCTDIPAEAPAEVAVAALPPPAPPPGAASGGLPAVVETSEIRDREPPAEPPVATPAAAGDGRFISIGSYAVPANADERVAEHESLKPFIVEATVAGRSLLRVVVGPFERKALKAALARLRVAGIADPWILPADANLRRAPTTVAKASQNPLASGKR